MLSLISNITLFLSSIIYFLFKNLQKKLNIFLRGFKKFEVNLIDVSKKKNPKKQVNVLIMDTVHHRLNIYTDCILIEYLQNIFNCKITGLMEKNDNQSKSFFNFIKSKNIIEINDSKIFKKLKFFFQAFKIIKNFKSYNINKFIELKIDEINLGRSVYDHIIRLTRIGKHNRYNSKFVNYLADALYYKEKFSNIFKYNHFEYLILSELQFLPSNILIQVALKHNVKVVSRILGPKKIGVRIYKKFEERFQSNNKILNEMFKKIPQKNLEKYSKIGYKKIKGIYKKKTNNPDFFSKSALIRQNKFENKKDLLMHFGWKDEKKICTIFSPNMIDGNFYHEMKLFPDIQTWLEQTLNIIKKSEQNINLLVRPHPSESYFPKLITKTENIFKEIVGEHPNIKLCPNDCSPATVKELTKIAITSHGSVGVEYPSFGIPVVIAGDSFYSGNGFNIEPKNIKDYVNTIKNLEKFIHKGLNNNQIKLARALYYLHQFVIQMDCPLLDVKFDISDKENFDNFISDVNKLRKKYDIKKDNFFRKFNYQVINNNNYLMND